MTFPQGLLVKTVEIGRAADEAGIGGGNLPVLVLQEMILGGNITVGVYGHELVSIEDAREVVRQPEIGQIVKVNCLARATKRGSQPRLRSGRSSIVISRFTAGNGLGQSDGVRWRRDDLNQFAPPRPV